MVIQTKKRNIKSRTVVMKTRKSKKSKKSRKSRKSMRGGGEKYNPPVKTGQVAKLRSRFEIKKPPIQLHQVKTPVIPTVIPPVTVVRPNPYGNQNLLLSSRPNFDSKNAANIFAKLREPNITPKNELSKHPTSVIENPTKPVSHYNSNPEFHKQQMLKHLEGIITSGPNKGQSRFTRLIGISPEDYENFVGGINLTHTHTITGNKTPINSKALAKNPAFLEQLRTASEKYFMSNPDELYPLAQ